MPSLGFDSPLHSKVDAQGKHRLSEGFHEGPVEALVRTVTPLTTEQRSELLAAGCKIRSMMGNVLSIETDASGLDRIARLTFVRKIELPRTLRQD